MGNEVGFEHEITELRLGLPSQQQEEMKNEKKRVFSETGGGGGAATNKVAAVTVGWPPVCSYRRRSIGSEKECEEISNSNNNNNNKRLVKISMDGVPFLRKIDVNGYQDYFALLLAVHNLFGCPSIEKALEDADNSEYVPIYEDKDGDWLLIGDVPWKMFVESCKRLRIMKRTDAKGIGLQSKKHIMEGC